MLCVYKVFAFKPLTKHLFFIVNYEKLCYNIYIMLRLICQNKKYTVYLKKMHITNLYCAAITSFYFKVILTVDHVGCRIISTFVKFSHPDQLSPILLQ